MERYMQYKELLEFFNVGKQLLDRWVQNNALAADRTESWFSHTAIEALLRAHPSSPEALKDMPSLMELLVLAQTLKSPPLLTRAEAQAWLGVTKGVIDAALLADLPSIRLPNGGVRILLTTLIDYSERREGAVPAEVAVKMLGVRHDKIATLAPRDGSGPLIRQDVPNSNARLFVTQESLMQVITGHLSTGTAQAWWDLRLAFYFEPLRTLDWICREYHIGVTAVQQAIDDGTLPCLVVPGNKVRFSRIPHHALDQWASTSIRMSTNQLGHIFGIPGRIVSYSWVICPIPHAHHISRSCLTGYIEAHKMSPFNARVWLGQALRHPLPTVLLSKLSEAGSRLTLGRAYSALRSGRLRGVRLPNGDVAILRIDVESL